MYHVLTIVTALVCLCSMTKLSPPITIPPDAAAGFAGYTIRAYPGWIRTPQGLKLPAYLGEPSVLIQMRPKSSQRIANLRILAVANPPAELVAQYKTLFRLPKHFESYSRCVRWGDVIGDVRAGPEYLSRVDNTKHGFILATLIGHKMLINMSVFYDAAATPTRSDINEFMAMARSIRPIKAR